MKPEFSWERLIPLGGIVALFLAVEGAVLGLQSLGMQAASSAGQSEAQSLTGPNRFANSGFEGDTRPVVFGEVNVFEGWQPFYCDQPYTLAKCPAERIGSGNPPGLVMGRPEYKPTDVANRVRSGATAQQWFCFFRTCRAGVYQTITTIPGETCEVSAWVQTWSSWNEFGSDGQMFHSRYATQDDRDNSTWWIKVDRQGGEDAFADGVLTSRAFTYEDGHFDQYAQIEYSFTAAGNQTTIFFENLRLWPFAHNDSYLDDAAVQCEGATPTITPSPRPTRTATASPPPLVCPTVPACEPVVVTVTPGPTGTPPASPTPGQPTPTPIVPLPTATPTPESGYPRFTDLDRDYRVLAGPLRIRNAPSTSGVAIGWRYAGDIVPVLCLWEKSAGGDLWASDEACLLPAKRWSAVRVSNTTYMEAMTVPLLYAEARQSSDTVPVTTAEAEMLIRLLVAEVRGMQKERENAGLSVLSTVWRRTQERVLSDGTLRSTLEWRSPGVYQFPPVVYLDDLGVNAPARLDEHEAAWAFAIVANYLAGSRGDCSGYLFYQSIPGQPSQCRIVSSGDQSIDFWSPQDND